MTEALSQTLAQTLGLVFADPAAAPLAAMLVLAAAPNIIMRAIGVFLSRGIDEGSEIFAFVRAVASALLAGVVGKLVVTPPGALAHLPLTVRALALGLAVAAFFGFRKSLLAAFAAGLGTIAVGFWLG